MSDISSTTILTPSISRFSASIPEEKLVVAIIGAAIILCGVLLFTVQRVITQSTHSQLPLTTIIPVDAGDASSFFQSI